MDSILNSEDESNCITVRRGGLGISVHGQRGQWHGVMPAARTRGDITRFSRASARRLRECLAMAKPRDASRVPFGVCLTIPGEILPPDEVRALWKDLLNKLRQMPELPFVWRIKLQ